MFPTAWQYREYEDSNGTVERWHIQRIDDRAYSCKRITYPSVDAMERARAAAERSPELTVTDPEASANALHDAEKEQSARFGTFYTAAAAVTFFAEGRAQAASAAYDIVAAVDNQLVDDGSK